MELNIIKWITNTMLVELFENEEFLAYLNDNAVESSKSPYDHVIYDSDIEESFAKRFEYGRKCKSIR